MKLIELLGVLATDTKVWLYLGGSDPVAFQCSCPDDCAPDYISVDDIYGWTCDRIVVDCIELCGEALFVFAHETEES